MGTEKQAGDARPEINVTPLIDILLVLLIIFMVITPLKPARFKALVPDPPIDDPRVKARPDTLVVTIEKDLRLRLNGLDDDMGTVSDTGRLSTMLARIFEQRQANRAYRQGITNLSELPETDRIERTVFIKAPRSLAYGDVAKVIDGIKGAGARPIGLQIDDLAN
jgi:biopolymer transport protein ExbD